MITKNAESYSCKAGNVDPTPNPDISDEEVEVDIFRIIKAYDDRPHLIKNAVRDHIKAMNLPKDQVERALSSLANRGIFQNY